MRRIFKRRRKIVITKWNPQLKPIRRGFLCFKNVFICKIFCKNIFLLPLFRANFENFIEHTFKKRDSLLTNEHLCDIM